MLCVGVLDPAAARRRPRWAFGAEVVHCTEEGTSRLLSAFSAAGPSTDPQPFVGLGSLMI